MNKNRSALFVSLVIALGMSIALSGDILAGENAMQEESIMAYDLSYVIGYAPKHMTNYDMVSWYDKSYQRIRSELKFRIVRTEDTQVRGNYGCFEFVLKPTYHVKSTTTVQTYDSIGGGTIVVHGRHIKNKIVSLSELDAASQKYWRKCE